MDGAGELLVLTHELFARQAANSTETGASQSNERPPVYKVVGLILAILSGLFIGVSFVMKKVGLLNANVKYHEEAGEGYGYLKNGWWWGGMTLMIIGEVCNFVAYAFVDAILVTPLGALSVVVTTILSAIFLKERLSFVGKVGCFNCIIGSVVIVINAPEQSAVSKIQDMKRLVLSPGFLSYAGIIIVACTFLALWAGPRYGKKSMLVYLSICSLIGGLSVVATQGLGAAIVTQIGGEPQFNQWFLYLLLAFVIATLLTEIIYLNKALNLFNAALVTPTYYVFFTTSTIVTSAILFRGFKGTPATISTVIMGFLQICAGVILLQLSKSAKDVPDAAVFKGDLDQVRTVAEQKEPEYEPKADSIRAGGALLRSMSNMRQRKEAEDAKRIHEERMAPIGENEQVEFDGLRRRKTVLEPGQAPLQRRKTLHPPLGMSEFPDDDTQSTVSDDIHPGFFTRLSHRRRRQQQAPQSPPPPMPLSSLHVSKTSSPPASSLDGTSSPAPHVYGLPPGLLHHTPEDTAYHSPSAIHWDPSVADDADRPRSRDRLGPPRPPPHTAKRQFSFQNVFSRSHKREASDGAESSAGRPVSRGALSFTSRKSGKEHAPPDRATEEERLGLVKGDSQNLLTLPEYSSPPESSDTEEDWQVMGVGVGGTRVASPPAMGTVGAGRDAPLPQPTAFEPMRGARRVDSDDDTDDDHRDEVMRDKYDESRSDRGGGAFM